MKCVVKNAKKDENRKEDSRRTKEKKEWKKEKFKKSLKENFSRENIARQLKRVGKSMGTGLLYVVGSPIWIPWYLIWGRYD
jgi:hypothetical protein